MTSSSTYNFTGKLAYRFQPQMKMEYTFLLDGAERQGSGTRASDFLYRYNPQGLSSRKDRSQNHALHWTHTLNPNTFYTVRLSYAIN